MDPLARLRDDMDMAGGEAEGLGENVLDACLDIFDEFIAGWEVKRARVNRTNRGILHTEDTDEIPGAVDTFLTIIVPRERKPSMLEAMETAHRYLSYLCRAAGDPGVTAEGARDALAEAIAKEKSNA